MQQFLPYANFVESARCLDMKRLGKMRVENLQLLNSIRATKLNLPYRGWKNHPAREMFYYPKLGWDYTNALVELGRAYCLEWRSRGYKDTCLEKISAHYDSSLHCDIPPWLGREDIHQSHRSMLIQKKPDYYKQIWPDEKDDLEYVWPTR